MKPGYHFSTALCLIVLVVLLTGCHCLAETPSQGASVSNLTSGHMNEVLISSVNESDHPVRIGVLANRGSDIAMQEWGPTAEYLSRELSPVSFVIVPLDFNQTSEAVKQRNVSFICTNPSVYASLEYYGLAKGIATLQVPGDPSPQALYGAVIFTRSDRDEIRNLSDLNGTAFAAVDPISLGGWQAACAELLKAGITPDKEFKSLNFTGTHDAVVYAVLNGTADAGTVRSTQLERMAKEGKISLSDIRILNDKKVEHPNYPYLLSTPLYPEWPFASVSGTDPDLSKKVSAALLRMDENDPAAVAARGAGWAVPQDHTSVQELLKQLKLPPYDSEEIPVTG